MKCLFCGDFLGDDDDDDYFVYKRIIVPQLYPPTVTPLLVMKLQHHLLQRAICSWSTHSQTQHSNHQWRHKCVGELLIVVSLFGSCGWSFRQSRDGNLMTYFFDYMSKQKRIEKSQKNCILFFQRKATSNHEDLQRPNAYCYSW